MALLTFAKLSPGVPPTQVAARTAVQRVFRTFANRPAGWLAWALELRNAVVHRGHLTQVWLPVPPKGDRPFVIKTDMPAHLLARAQPHLRGRPWHPDMVSLSGTGSPTDQLVWLPEPASATLRELQAKTVELVEEISGCLETVLTGDRSSWVLPAQVWRLGRKPSGARIRAAEDFRGFDPMFPVTPMTEMRVHSRSVPRLRLAERLRVRSSAPGGWR